jgi:hypothetical protein
VSRTSRTAASPDSSRIRTRSRGCVARSAG